jgi:Ni,Fe-hydrogenase III small subunit
VNPREPQPIVAAGGSGACEADLNVLGIVVFDLGRFGIQFVASPRHAAGLVVTGPVSENMRSALLETYAAIPAPKLVIAVGAAAISGGVFRSHPEVHDGCSSLLPVDLFIPGVATPSIDDPRLALAPSRSPGASRKLGHCSIIYAVHSSQR